MTKVKIDNKNADSEKPMEHELDKFITVFTDGSFCPNSMAWGVGIWYKVGCAKSTSISIGGKGEFKDSNKVESHGLLLATRHIIENNSIDDKVVVIQCDNVNALNSMIGFIRREFIKNGARYVKAKHVKAHTSNKTKRSYVNKLVDRLAYEEMSKRRG